MPGEFNVAFWNVQNLFESGVVDRGPQSRQEFNEKLDALADIIQGFFHGDGPDLIGLAEVGSLNVFDNLIDRLGGSFSRVWEPTVGTEHTGLGIAARAERFEEITLLEVWRPSIGAHHAQ